MRVLDPGHVFQGPYATFLMAMAGAEVIKIEPPRGDMMQHTDEVLTELCGLDEAALADLRREGVI